MGVASKRVNLIGLFSNQLLSDLSEKSRFIVSYLDRGRNNYFVVPIFAS
jgi:hypothetical protein